MRYNLADDALRSVTVKKFFCALLALSLTGLVCAERVPEQQRQESKEYPAAIEQQVEGLNRRKLLDDSYFVKSLKTELKNKKHSEEEKVYYFYLMLRQIRWGFIGVVWMRPDGQYADEFLFQSHTFANYRTELQKLKLDSAPFYQLGRDNAAEKPILASYALLLATMLEDNDEQAFAELASSMDALLPQAAYPLRPMLIHNLCYSFMLVQNEQELPALAVMSDYAILEEEKEDITIVAALSGHELAIDWVFQTLIDITDSSDDLLAHSCMYLLQRMISEDSFKTMLKVYKEHAKSDFQTELADLVVANGYEPPYLGGSWAKQSGLFAKFWDCHDVMFTFYDDGLYVSSGNFAEFIPN